MSRKLLAAAVMSAVVTVMAFRILPPDYAAYHIWAFNIVTLMLVLG
jgi:hypothetical protein